MRYINWLLKTGSGSLCWTIVTLWCRLQFTVSLCWRVGGHKDTRKYQARTPLNHLNSYKSDNWSWQGRCRLTQLTAADGPGWVGGPHPARKHSASHDFTQTHTNEATFLAPWHGKIPVEKNNLCAGMIFLPNTFCTMTEKNSFPSTRALVRYWLWVISFGIFGLCVILSWWSSIMSGITVC